MTRLAAFTQMKELMTRYYIEAKTTADRPVGWITSGAPVEFLYAMDAIPVYPENYAAMCAAGHQSVALMEAAEAAGFSQDICAYARTDFGQDLVRGGPAGGLPAPQFLVCSTNICRTVVKWYEVVARKYRVPLFVVDTPFQIPGAALRGGHPVSARRADSGVGELCACAVRTAGAVSRGGSGATV